MANERMGELASEIGAILAEDAVYPLERTLLYAQVGENWVGPDVYKDGGATIMYQWASKKLTYPLLELWEESDADNRWSEIEYWIENGRFDIRFVFPEEIDADEDDNERRDKIVKRYFGDRPIVYPAFPTGDDILNFNL